MIIMAYERRGEKTYYYEKRRDGDKVVSIYHGRGDTADEAAALVKRRAKDRRFEKACLREDLAAAEHHEEIRARYHDTVRRITAAGLRNAGFKWSEGRWRRRRRGRPRLRPRQDPAQESNPAPRERPGWLTCEMDIAEGETPPEETGETESAPEGDKPHRAGEILHPKRPAGAAHRRRPTASTHKLSDLL